MTTNYPHVMVDIETLSTNSNARVTEVAVMAFNPFLPSVGVNIAPTYLVQPVSFWGQPDRDLDENTVQWWQSTSQHRLNFFLTFMENSSLRECRHQVAQAMQRVNDAIAPATQVWAKSPSFDLVILRSLMADCGVEPSWSYRSERDVRTAVALLSIDEDIVGEQAERTLKLYGEPHMAGYDCAYQINLVSRAYHRLKLATLV